MVRVPLRGWNFVIGSLQYEQEEDFVTQNYNRNLLAGVSIQAIRDEISYGKEWLSTKSNISPNLKDVLDDRLRFVDALILALESALDAPHAGYFEAWKSLGELVSQVRKTKSLGQPVDEAFSIKIQRRLATTVPPRPMVHIELDVALDFLEKLCKDMIDAQNILDYRGTNNLLVRLPSEETPCCRIDEYRRRYTT